MSLFGKRGETGAERRERSAAERERARLEREARRAGKPLPPAPEPDGGVSTPRGAVDPPRSVVPSAPEPDGGVSTPRGAVDPPRSAAPPPAEPEASWFETPTRQQATVTEPAPPAAAAQEQPIGTRRAGAPTVRDLPQVAGPQPPRRGTPQSRRGARRAVGVGLLLVVVAIGWFLVSLFEPFAGDGEGSVRVTVPTGADPGTVGDLLASNGVVGSSFFFELRARLAGESGNLRAGAFTLRRDMSYGAAIEALTTAPPPPRVLKVTIPEGRARTEIVPLLKGSGLRGSYLRASEPRRAVLRRYGAPSDTPSLEGFLYPATYELKVGATARDLVDKQLDAFDAVARKVKLRSRARRLDLDGYQVLSIAAMIEREVIVPRERRLVSAVIHNRLEQGIPLGIDATIRYRLRNWDRPLRQSELQIDSGYNTRTRQGLPPTPIGNPSEAAIEAALNPAKVSHLFYVVKPCGEGAHAFSATDAQFQRDVAAYNRARDARGGKDPSNC